MQDQKNDQIDGEEVPTVPAEAQEIKNKPEQADGKEESQDSSFKKLSGAELNKLSLEQQLYYQRQLMDHKSQTVNEDKVSLQKEEESQGSSKNDKEQETVEGDAENEDAKSQQEEKVEEDKAEESILDQPQDISKEKYVNIQPKIKCRCKKRFPLQQSEQITGMKCKGKGGQSIGFLPLRELSLDVDIVDSIAVIKMIQEYINPCEPENCDSYQPQELSAAELGKLSLQQQLQYQKKLMGPIEVTFQFPKEADSVISKMQLTVGNKTIQAKVMENEKAEQKYDDQIAKGNVAALLKKNKNSFDLHQIDIGNILPGQTVKVEISIIQPLKIQGGAFDFVFPMTYYPAYNKSDHSKPGLLQKMADASSQNQKSKCEEDLKLSFNFRVNLRSTNPIYEVSHPNNCEILEQSQNDVVIQKIESDYRDLQKDIHVYYRTLNMEDPRFVYQRSDEFKGCVAVMAQFLPTFEAKQPQDDSLKKINYIDNEEEIEEKDIDSSLVSKNIYTFVVDRSGSMRREKMDITKESLKLFIQSLPIGSVYQILSFGTSFDRMTNQQTTNFEYTDDNVNWTKEFINGMDANYGGTNIYAPLEDILVHKNRDVLTNDMENKMKNRIFLLTDGQVNNKDMIVNLVGNYCNQKGNDNFRVFTFGVGDDCDKSLVKEIAIAGHGSYNFAADTNLSVLKTKVIDALSKAQEPALSNCTFDFGIEKKDSPLNEDSLMDPSQKFKSNQLFRNQITRYYTVMSEDQFKEDFTCTFDCQFDPKTKSSINHQFEKARFEEIQPHEEMDYLFKMACKFKIDELKEANQSKSQIVKLSTKYQVLSDETSFMGVVKQKTKSDVESKKISIGSITGIKQKKSHFNALNYVNNNPMSSQACMGFGGIVGGSKMAAGGPPPSYGMAPGSRGGPQPSYGMAAQSRGSLRGNLVAPPSSYGKAAGQRGLQDFSSFDQAESFSMSKASSMKKSKAKKSTGQGLFSGIGSALQSSSQSSMPDKSQKKSSGGILSSLFGKAKDIEKKEAPPAKLAQKQNTQKFELQSEMMSDALEELDDMMASAEDSQSYGCAMMSAAPLPSSQMMGCMSSAPQTPAKNLKYEEIISIQSADGSWSMDFLNQILKFVPSSSVTAIRQQIQSESKKNQKAMLTALVLAILMTNFQSDRDEWKLIEKKAKNYIKSNPCEKADYKLFESQVRQISEEEDMMARLMAL